MIRVEGVVKRFGSAIAVDNVSVHVPAGDSVALWGANGAGKTTLIRCVLGLFRFSGRVSVGGHDVATHGKQARRLIGYVPQELGFYDDLRVSEAIRLFARLKGLGSIRTGDVLEQVTLGGHEWKRIRELSGGMKQRLALAIALLGDPPVLVLDEVTASLDACGREEFVGLIAGLVGGLVGGLAGGEAGGSGRASGGRTLLFASHRSDEVATLAQRVVLLDRGRLVGECPAQEFVHRLGADAVLHLHVADLLRAEAMKALRAGGFDPRLNGVGVHVPVTTSQKAVPFRILADARIAVDDFEVIATGQHGMQHEAPRRAETQP